MGIAHARGWLNALSILVVLSSIVLTLEMLLERYTFHHPLPLLHIRSNRNQGRCCACRVLAENLLQRVASARCPTLTGVLVAYHAAAASLTAAELERLPVRTHDQTSSPRQSRTEGTFMEPTFPFSDLV